MTWLLGLFFALFLHLPVGLSEEAGKQDLVLSEMLSQEEYELISQYPELLDEYRQSTPESFGSQDSKGLRTQQITTISIPQDVKEEGIGFRHRVKINQSNHWEARFLADQDPGEHFRTGPVPCIPAHVSGGFLIRPGGLLREVIIGDFQVNSGFGAVMASSPVFNTTLGEPGLLHRPGRGIRLHTGTDENRFFRGVAARIIRGKSELILFGTGKQTAIGRDTVPQQGGGIIYDLRLTKFELGASVAGFHQDTLSAQDPEWENIYRDGTQAFLRTGIWGQFRVPFGILFGEAGWSPGRGTACVAGFRLFETSGFSAVLRFTASLPGYPVWYTLFQTGTALTRSRTRLICSWKYSRNRHVAWFGLLQAETDSWPGADHFLQPAMRTSQRLLWQLPNRWSLTGTATVTFAEYLNAWPDAVNWKVQLDTDPGLESPLRIRVGVQQSVSGFGENLASGITGDIAAGLQLWNGKLRLISGFRVFSIENGVSPIYGYEPDVLYGWSAPVLSGSGTRWYLNLRWTALPGLVIEGKVYQTGYSDLKHLSEDNRGGIGGKVQISWTKELRLKIKD
ncbi:MAG: hypothetical protein V2A67_03625 [Bacteroidota bacterium]